MAPPVVSFLLTSLPLSHQRGHRPVSKRPIACASPNSTPKSPKLPTVLVLNAVPFLWGTYTPAAQALSRLPIAPPLELLNLLVYLAALAPLSVLVPSDDPLPLRAGAELGTYLFLGTTLFLFALQDTSAARAALLVQLTTIFVPVLNRLLGRAVPRRVWLAAGLATMAAAILERPSVGFAFGDVLAVGAALAYSVHVVRLETLCRNDGGALPLVTAKARAQVVLAMIAVALHGNANVAYIASLPYLQAGDFAVLLVGVAWLGGATTALATWLQVIGQARVGGSRAAVFYATQPAWALAFAYAAGLDHLAAIDFVGAALIIGAGFVAGVE